MNANEPLFSSHPLHTACRRVEFAETDMAGLVHFSNYFRWMEATEAAFFRALDHPMVDGRRGWPRVRASCEFHAPLRFGDTLEIDLYIEALKIKAIAYRFRIHRLQHGAREVLAASGKLTTLFVEHDPDNGVLTSHQIPRELVARIQALAAKSGCA